MENINKETVYNKVEITIEKIIELLNSIKDLIKEVTKEIASLFNFLSKNSQKSSDNLHPSQTNLRKFKIEKQRIMYRTAFSSEKKFVRRIVYRHQNR